MSKKFSEFTNVTNPAGASQIVGFSGGTNTRQRIDSLPISTATQTALNDKASAAGLAAHIANTSNPHATTKAQVGLGSVPNVDATNMANAASGVLAVARGGTGTATPGLVQGTNVTITGTWPNQTINSTGGGGSAAWGGITGTLSAQTDLATALALLAPKLNALLSGTTHLTGAGTTLYVEDGADILLANGDGVAISKPLSELPRVIGDGDTPTVLVTDLIIDYQRTDEAPLVVAPPGDALAGQHLTITNSSASPLTLSSPSGNAFFNGSLGEVSSIVLESRETIAFINLNNPSLTAANWRVVSRYFEILETVSMSTGSGDAGKIPLLDGDGWLSDTFLPDSGVTPGSYTNVNVTVDETGRITTISNGSGGGGGGGGDSATLWASAAQSLNAGSNTLLTLDTLTSPLGTTDNVGGIGDTTTSTITIATNGTYLLNMMGSIDVLGNTKVFLAGFIINNGSSLEMRIGQLATGTNDSYTISGPLKLVLTAGTTIRAFVYTNDSGRSTAYFNPQIVCNLSVTQLF